MRRIHHRRAGLVAVAALVCVASLACSDDSGTDDAASDRTTTTVAPNAGGGPLPPILFNGQGNNLDAYATEPSADGTFATQRVLQTVEADPANGRDVNAQICFLPRTDTGEQWFIAGEDTGQDDPTRPPGWGIFRLEGEEVGDLEATQIGKLVPTYQPANDNPENYGCGVLNDGRVLTTDVGNQALGDGDGQLIIWFPPLTGGTFPDFDEVPYCKLDVGLPTAQSILVLDDIVYVAAARGAVYRYDGPFPSAADADGGCGRTDATGAPLADSVVRTTFVPAGANGVATPSGLAPAPDRGMYVSSVFTGVIAEFGLDGKFRRTVLQPPEGETLSDRPYSSGSPLGLAVDAAGNLYYADIGIVVGPDGVGPGDRTGSVRRVTFPEDGEPGLETMATGLEFPDGLGVWDPDGP